jgi:hypothetical protein
MYMLVCTYNETRSLARLLPDIVYPRTTQPVLLLVVVVAGAWPWLPVGVLEFQ